ncbi:hypothetical protein K439DRAFT_1630416, partial [Ramaria rubella]
MKATTHLTLPKLYARRRDLEFEAKGLQDQGSGGITPHGFPHSTDLPMSSKPQASSPSLK